MTLGFHHQMEEKSVNSHARNSVIAAAVLLAFPVVQGCASKDWVKQQMDPVAAQVSKNEQRLTQAEGQISTLGGRVNKVEGGLGEFQGKLGSVDAKTDKALDAIANLKLEKRVVIDLKEGANFKFDSANLPAHAKKEIDRVLGELKNQPGGTDGAVFVVAGHTDNAGSENYNYELGQKRADAVAHYLIAEKKMDRIQVVPVSYGKSAPLVANKSIQERAKNRRVELLVYREEIKTGLSSTAAAPKTDKRAGAETLLKK